MSKAKKLIAASGGGSGESPILYDFVEYVGDGVSPRGIPHSTYPSVLIRHERLTSDTAPNGSPLGWHDGTPASGYYTYSFGANYSYNTVIWDDMEADGTLNVGAAENETVMTYRHMTFTAGSGFVTDTSGDISAEVNASVAKGFSHVTYTGNGVAGEAIPHGLGGVPDFIWFKGMGGHNTIFPREAMIQISRAGDSQYVQLGGTINSNYTAPTSDFFYTNASNNNSSGKEYHAWCFKAVSGLSDFGYYTGNGSTNGPTITTGFKPDFVIIGGVNGSTGATSSTQYYFEEVDADGGGNIYDSALWNSSYGPHSSVSIRLQSTGFRVTGTNVRINDSGYTYFYAAFKKG